ncbi:uncharacterized protein B0I36DRAFT_437091 [Microdochium trichocladiopsis]|uniref:Uncharacterized protein n=1 Tax=Microdochium trichocladiopsis TaxID=1682393 RepID=A0A9P8XPR5_9PEZI|nr:uncharacterized protein B0I36DRAFT_437091 [Microdochium trichocladiopsis]KAH7009306.1 hypothetical protein B0I36DRAFT_437091 [Microdochium trichocladiopsis]
MCWSAKMVYRVTGIDQGRSERPGARQPCLANALFCNYLCSFPSRPDLLFPLQLLTHTPQPYSSPILLTHTPHPYSSPIRLLDLETMSHSSGLSTCQPGESANPTGSQAPEVEIARRRSAASNSARIHRTMPSEVAIARCPYQPSSAAGTPPPGNGSWPSTSWAPGSFKMQPQVPVALQYQRAWRAQK